MKSTHMSTNKSSDEHSVEPLPISLHRARIGINPPKGADIHRFLANHQQVVTLL